MRISDKITSDSCSAILKTVLSIPVTIYYIIYFSYITFRRYTSVPAALPALRKFSFNGEFHFETYKSTREVLNGKKYRENRVFDWIPRDILVRGRGRGVTKEESAWIFDLLNRYRELKIWYWRSIKFKQRDTRIWYELGWGEGSGEIN